jgi:hypothetical protein
LFYTTIEDIIALQQTRRKKIMEEELDAPLTVDHLKSARMTDNQNEAEDKPQNLKIEATAEGGRKYCC